MTKLTIGMAHYDDFYGVYSTVHSLLLYHPMKDVEIIVVDNSPHTEHGQEVRNLMRALENASWNTRYIPMSDSTGTTQPRERIFAEASGDAVLCCDCHVMFPPGTIERLLAYYDAHPTCKDILQGPLMYDHLTHIETDFKPVWRGEMWGVWHFDERGRNVDDAPFEIWGQGLGVFTCKKDAWLHFNPHFRQFGGEEGYIHEKFRQAGHKALCLPFLRWTHRFPRPGGPRYPRQRYAKVRNYVLGHLELGLDLAPIHEHFVATGLISQMEWDWIINDPVAHELPKNFSPAALVDLEKKDEDTFSKIYTHMANKPRDLNEHFNILTGYAGKCDHVTEITKRRESTVAFIGAKPAVLISYQTEVDPILDALHKIVDREKLVNVFTTNVGPLAHSEMTDIEETDLLYIDSKHDGDYLLDQLRRFGTKVRKYIILRGTQSFALTSEAGGGRGLLHGWAEFAKEHPQWKKVHHAPNQYGMTVFSCLPNERNIDKGPGSKLKEMLVSLGITSSPSCDCNAKAMQMDNWGPEGCKENFDTIVRWLRDNHERWGWADYIKAATLAVTTGLAFKLNPTDPFPGLVTEAIRRSELETKE